jgi:ABC-type branched-subunit amino acid transport system permease subunit
MRDVSPNTRSYVLAAALGAIAGGLFVAFATKAIPKMMSQIMSGMMQNMMARMREAGCAPQEI